MSDEEKARQTILARRARFVAAAMLSAGVMGCDEKPTTCLSIAVDTAPPDAGRPAATTAPTICLAAPHKREPDPVK